MPTATSSHRASHGGRRGRRWVFGASLVPAVLAVLVQGLAFLDEGDPIALAAIPLLMAWVGAIPLVAGIAVLRADPEDLFEDRAAAITVLVATVAWPALLAIAGTSTAVLGIVVLPGIQGLAWAAGSWFAR